MLANMLSFGFTLLFLMIVQHSFIRWHDPLWGKLKCKTFFAPIANMCLFVYSIHINNFWNLNKAKRKYCMQLAWMYVFPMKNRMHMSVCRNIGVWTCVNILFLANVYPIYFFFLLILYQGRENETNLVEHSVEFIFYYFTHS